MVEKNISSKNNGGTQNGAQNGAHNGMHNASQSGSQNRNSKNNYRGNSNKTKRYRHEKLEHKRPQLSRTQSNSASSQKNKQGRTNYKNNRQRRGANRGHSNAVCKVIPLGGLDAIGKNMTAFECADSLIVDDAGLMFPDDNHPGIDLILPDYTYVLENAHKLKGIVVTHGHEDHTGALPYLVKDLGVQVPIYASKMTLGLIEGKFAEHKIKNAKLIEVKSGSVINLGCIKAEFFSVNHSIPGALGVFFTTPAGNILHTGDFKLDQSPIDGVHTDFAAISRFSQTGVDLMMSDSTNALNKNFTPSEAEVGDVLSSIINSAKGRVIIASFASHIHRMQQICDAAIAAGRKVVVTGRSMIQNTDIARRLGYLSIADKDLIDAYYLDKTPAHKVVVMCTGSQGEPLSALSRIASGDHKTIHLDAGDTVIISATPVPGNEKAVTRVVNDLAKLGCDVWDKSRAMVHVSGHAGSEELKLMMSMVDPEYFMPVHGEATHLRAHATLAQKVGIKQKNIFICENGESLEIRNGVVKTGPVYPSGIVYVDGLSVGDTSQEVLDDRSTMAQQGLCALSAACDFSRRRIVGDMKLSMRGITGGDDPYLLRDVERCAQSALKTGLGKNMSEKELQRNVSNAMRSILWERTKQKPIILTNLLEV